MTTPDTPRSSPGHDPQFVSVEHAAPSPSPAYPEPRRPLTQPVPTVPMPPPSPAYATPQYAPPPPPPPSRPRRLGLILGITIPLAVLLIAALIAALVVPGIITDRNAQAAADTFQQQRDDWAATYEGDALAALTNFDGGDALDAFGSLYDNMGATPETATVLDAVDLRTSCDRIAGIAADSIPAGAARAPEQPAVDGGERNAAYRAAAAQWAAEQPRYAAAETLAADAQAAFDDIAAICAFALREVEIHNAAVAATAAFVSTLTLPQGAEERLNISATEYVAFTCLDQLGCAPFLDRAGRAATGDAWDAANTTLLSDAAALHRDLCPTTDLAAACAEWKAAFEESARLSAAVGEAYRTEDLASYVIANPTATDAAPVLNAAIDAYLTDSDAALARASAATSASNGYPGLPGAMWAELDEAAAAIRDASRAVAGL